MISIADFKSTAPQVRHFFASAISRKLLGGSPVPTVSRLGVFPRAELTWRLFLQVVGRWRRLDVHRKGLVLIVADHGRARGTWLHVRCLGVKTP